MKIQKFALILLALSVLFLTACPTDTTPKAEPDIKAFTAKPTTISAGEESTLSWAVTGDGVTLEIDKGVGTVTGDSTKVSPTQTTVYTLTATNDDGEDTDAATVTVSGTETPTIESTFDETDDEGWTVNFGTLENSDTGGSGEGSDNGFITTKPPGEGETSYYIAPAKFHTDWQSFSALSVDLRSSGGSYYSGNRGATKDDIYMANGELTAQLLLSKRPDEEWENFTLDLSDDSAWTFGGGATSLNEILGNVTDFQVRAEYGVGSDKSGLDNVRLVPGD